jgi:hypothetical protein
MKIKKIRIFSPTGPKQDPQVFFQKELPVRYLQILSVHEDENGIL